MIHLDRSHPHDLDQTQKQNLILSRDHDASHFDWDDLSHTADNPPFFHDALHQQLPLSPHNIHLPPDTSTSPARQPHDLDDKSSSLSPAPDSGSPPPHQNTAHLPPPQTVLHPPLPDKHEPDLTIEGILTPLTELSPAPDLDDAPEDNKDSIDDHKDHSHPNPSSVSQDDHRRVPPAVHVNGVSSPPTSSSGSPSRQFPITDIISSRLNGASAFAGPSHSRTSSGEFLVPSLPSGLSVPATGHPSVSDTKVVRVLEINAELFNVCLQFQLRGIPFSDSRFQQYAARLHVNLTWLAAAADQRHNSPSIALPAMDPPIPVEFMPMDRIHHLYSDLSTIFAKDFARRQLLNATHHGSPIAPSVTPNGMLKRTRPDDFPDLSSKRRDVGEKKQHIAQPPPHVGSLPGATSHPHPPTTFAPPTQSNIALSTPQAVPQSPRVSSPAMHPPSTTPSLPFAATEASIAASSRTRARELQIQQAREQQLRQAAHMQQIQAGRHMSPPSTSQQVVQGVPGGVPGGGQLNAAYGPQAQQLGPTMQNHNQMLMQSMMQQMPQFTSLPPQQQMQKLQMVQNALAQRQQQQQHQNPQVATPQRNPQMAGMIPNASMHTMSNGAMGAGVSSPVSPLVQRSPVMSQPQQMMNQSPQNGMFSFAQGHPNAGMDPRIASVNFSSQMPGGMPSNMNVNQQRQLMFMQQQQQQQQQQQHQQQQQQQQQQHQQQHMRNASGNMNMNAVPNMMNSQHAFAMAQRMAQAGPSQPGSGVGSPMSASAGDQFPALRSNSTIPGIARSARSPSDGLHSPMTPRAPSRLSQQPQLQQNDYSQAMMQHSHASMAQNPGTFNPQTQNLNWPQNGQQPMQHQMGMVAGQMNGYAMGSPGSAAMGGGFFGSTPSHWQQHPQGMTGYPYAQSMNQHSPSDQGRLSHMTGMSIPQNMSPMADGSVAPGEYDIFNYNGS